MVDTITPCKNCQSTIAGKYCSNCGQPAALKRVNGHYIMHEIQHILHFEKGILYTIKELLTHPGRNVREFITDNRSRLVKPIIFIIVTSLVYTSINHFFHVEEEYVDYHGEKRSATTAIFAWVQNHYGYANIIMGIFIAMWLKLFFRKNDYNFFEILILLCFVMGIGMLIFSVFTIAQAFMKLNIMQVAAFAGIAYCTWAIGQFFNSKNIWGYLGSLVAYLLGMATFSGAVILAGALIDMLHKTS